MNDKTTVSSQETTLDHLVPDDKNFNKETEFGTAKIEKSPRRSGAGRSIVIDKNNQIIAGNKTIKNAASKSKDSSKLKPVLEPKRSAGRPKVIIDWSAVDKYLKAGCTGTGIAGILGIHQNTLYDACRRTNMCDFSAYSQQKKAEGDDMLRAKQFDMAMEGDRVMAIWLGKQRLGQRETPQDIQDIIPKTINFTITETLIEAKEDGRENNIGTDN